MICCIYSFQKNYNFAAKSKYVENVLKIDNSQDLNSYLHIFPLNLKYDFKVIIVKLNCISSGLMIGGMKNVKKVGFTISMLQLVDG